MLTLGSHRIPTSASKPQGPTIGPTYDSEEAEKAFRDANAMDERIVTRTKFDPFSDVTLDLEPTSPLQVPGQAFFITNNEPVYFWDFARMMWKEMGHVPSRRLALPKTVGVALGWLSEWAFWCVGKEPAFTRFRANVSANSRYFNIEKARRVLGYEPQVGLEDGIKRTIDVSYCVQTIRIEIDDFFIYFSGGIRKARHNLLTNASRFPSSVRWLQFCSIMLIHFPTLVLYICKCCFLSVTPIYQCSFTSLNSVFQLWCSSLRKQSHDKFEWHGA